MDTKRSRQGRLYENCDIVTLFLDEKKLASRKQQQARKQTTITDPEEFDFGTALKLPVSIDEIDEKMQDLYKLTQEAKKSGKQAFSKRLESIYNVLYKSVYDTQAVQAKVSQEVVPYCFITHYERYQRPQEIKIAEMQQQIAKLQRENAEQQKKVKQILETALKQLS